MLNIGAMNRRITIERLTETISASGDVTKAWTEIASTWAQLIQQSTTEFFTGYGEAETGSVIFRIRWRTGITTADRVTYAGTAYDIKEVKEIGWRDGLELRAEAIQ